MPALTDDVHGVLRELLGLYGAGQPSERAAAVLAQSMAADLSRLSGGGARGYGDALGIQRTVLDTQYGRDGVVTKTVGESGAGTLTGRGVLSSQISDLQARIQAITTIGDTRFSGPALLDSAQQTITNATRQVNADIDAARRQAAQIMPPVALAERTRKASSPPRKRRRRRPRMVSAQQVANQPARRGIRRNWDKTRGGRAAQAADGALGLPYIWGGGGAGGPSGGGFDCSGLTQYAIAQATNGEVVLPRTTYDQIYAGERIDPREVRAGDLVFPASSFSSRGPEHVQLAAGNGMVIEAPYSGATVTYSPMPPSAVVVRVV
ncbi:C40 family peptidase [Nocardia zapadnayensis]|uniref:C40 family peptidase n=1 Tax=Nocardia rhamnosiphila TaxID=426716 RepID=UPI0022474FCE|nr:NlpC/P60 family protein [Nocardia zapadnayensis]MCX0273808.1 C40 family peptidase [Nocardia zapadnayensis]